MKGVMKGKIFKMIGIVLGSVLGFVGVVVGVMAAMGKFKTPIVYPTVLGFAITEQTIIEAKPYDTKLDWIAQKPTIYSFELVGSNPSYDHEVNQKSCYLWFDDGASAELITLCYGNGQPLAKDSNNRYLVNCNEPIYYMVNKLDENTAVGETDGKVVLQARSTNDTLKKPDSPMTIWIDREVESVFVKDSDWTDEYWYPTINQNNNSNTQNLSLGMDISFDFEYAVDTPLSIKPISRESAKEIELYYVATGYSADYIKVTEQEISNVNSPLNSIMSYKNGVYSFKSSVGGTYTFKIGVFSTYKDKQDYEALIQGASLINPNYDRTANMVLTTLNVTVENVEISKVGFAAPNNAVLNLYSTQDYITLYGTSGVDGAKDNNLCLYMRKGAGVSEVDDFSRFDEVSMDTLRSTDKESVEDKDIWVDRKARFEQSAIESSIYDGYVISLNGNTYQFTTNSNTMCIETSGIKFSNKLEVISFIYKSTDTSKANPYYCTNGVPVLDTSGSTPTIRILAPGSYMNFYAKNVDASGKDIYQILNFEHEAIVTGKGQSKSWNIITKEMPDPSTGDYLCFGILVVNSTGKFDVKNFFDTIPVNVEIMPLDYTIVEEEVNKEITFTESYVDGEGINYPEMQFSDFVTINGGSYNSCVFVVEEKVDADDKNINMVNVIPNIKYEVGTAPNKKTYVLVGNIGKDASGNDIFINSVKLNSNVAKDNNTCELVMLQLKNGFEESVNGLLDPLLATGATLGEDEVCNIYPLDAITVNAKYVLNASLLEYEYYDYYKSADSENNIVTSKNGNDINTVYENTDDLTIVISSKNISMWGLISNFYDFNVDFFDVLNYDSNLEIKEAEVVDGALVVTYETHSCLSDQNIVISILLENIGETLELPGISIMSGSPKIIALNANVGYGNIVTLADSIESAKDSTTYLTVVVGYNAIDYKYTYSYILNNNGVTHNIVEDIFNEEISSPEAGKGMSIGFQDYEDKGQTLAVEYDAVDKAIFNTVNLTSGEKLVEKSGSTVLSVKIGETTQYIKIVADTSAFAVSTTNDYNNNPSWDPTSINLDELVELNYNTTNPITLSTSQLVKITNVKCASYGDGNLITYPLAGGGWELKKSETDPAVLTIEEVDGVWNFKKTVPYVNLTISFDVETVADSNTSTVIHDNLNLRLTFGSTISVGVNNLYWEDRIIYAGTEVQLMDMNGDYALFDISTENTADVVKFEMIMSKTSFGSVEGSSSVTYDFTESLIGNISIKVYVNNVSIAEFGFNVKPNIVAKLNDVPYKSDTNYAVSNLYTLSSYDSSVIYGSSESNLYTKTVYYTDDTYITVSPTETEFARKEAINTTTANTTKLSVMPDSVGNTNPQLTGGANLLIGPMTELNTTITREIYLVYTYNAGTSTYVVSTDNISIVNKYLVTTSLSGENASTTYKALKEYDSFVVLNNAVTGAGDFELESIICDGMDIEINAAKTGFKIKNTVVQNREGVQFVVTFKHKTNGQILTYTTQGEDYDIIPYIPTELKTKEVAFSNNSYDLLNGIYNADDDTASDYIVNDANIKKLFVTAILDEERNDISSTVAPGFVSTGYTSGSLEPRCMVTFSEISGDSLQVFVQFTITYNDDLTYTYSIPLTINNRQKIEVEYPEQDMMLTSGVFKFVDGYTQDSLELSGETQAHADGIYELTNKVYEPTLIYTNSSTILDFKYDDIKKLNRAVVTDAKTNDAIDDAVLDIKVIAYQNNAGMAAYASSVITNYSDNQVSLPQTTQGMFGTLVFKLTTVSGNYKYYFVYVYCNGADTNVNSSNIMHVVAENGSTYPSNFTEKLATNVVTTTVDSNTTYVNLISGLSKYFDVFKISYNANTTKLFLYNGTFVGETPSNAFDYNSKQWKLLTNDDKININQYFNTITIGLVNDDGVKRYFYGTVVIYVQPNASVSETGLTYAYPNGEFVVKDLAPDTGNISCPFGTDWVAYIESITVDGKDFALSIPVSGGDMDLSDNRVGKDTLIRVKYTRKSIGTVAYVTYTYQATQLPNQEVLNSNPITIGNFIDEDAGFNNSIDLASTTNYATFFGTYKGTYSIASNNVNGEVDGSKVKFTQTTEQQNITITITYSNFGATGTTRDFTFIVRPGVYLDTSSSNSESGLSSDHAKSTIVTEDFTSFKGSKLDFEYSLKTDESGDNYYTYQVGDLKIYTTATSKLKLSFDLNNYVLNSTQTAVLSGSETLNVEPVSQTDVYFVHSAENKLVVMNIKVLTTEDKEYTTRNFYINVVPTYSSLKATYLVDDAKYENVPSADTSKTNLHESLLDTPKTVDLVLTDGTVKEDADLLNMGFAIYGNPNYIKFTTSGNAVLSDYIANPVVSIKFNSVTTNTMCQIFLNNDAGMVKNSVVYNYQIMASNDVDGLNFETTNGYNGSKDDYVSFMLSDTDVKEKAYTSEKFIFGSMLDMQNEGIFTLDSIKFGMAEVTNIQKLTIEEGYYVDDERTSGVNEANWAIIGGYTNAIQHIVKFSHIYTFYLTLDLDTKYVELIVHREETVLDKTNEFIISLSLGGVNGEATILDEFTIYLNNTQVVSNYQALLDTTIYSGDIINLFEDGKITENGGSTPTLIYEMANSTYSVDGQVYTIKATDYDNDLFKYDSSLKTIQTKTVGTQVTVALNLTVKSGTYVLKNIVYNFNINLNMQIVVNGADLSSNEGNSSPETYFTLTTVEDADADKQFPIEIRFESKSTLDTEGTDADVKNSAYKVLAFDLYRLRLQGNEEATDEEKLMSRNNVLVELYSAPSTYFNVTTAGIQFVKDYTGDIELKLSVKTDTGTYYVIWTIYVTGIATLENASFNSEFNRVQNNSLPFNSGASVDIIYSSTKTGTGVIMTTPTDFISQFKSSTVVSGLNIGDSVYGYYKEETDGTYTLMSSVTDVKNNNSEVYYYGIKVTYEYVINTFNETTKVLTNEDLFENTYTTDKYGYKKGLGEGNGVIVSNSYNITLPSVPSTSTDIQQSYLVTYKIYVEYLSLEYDSKITDNSKQKVEVFYISYDVINYQSVETYKTKAGVSSADINVDTAIDKTTESGKYYLDLFHYADIYTTSTTEYKFIYSENKIKLYIDDVFTDCVYDSSLDSNNDRVFITDDGSDKYTYNIASQKLYNKDNIEIAGGKWSKVPYYGFIEGQDYNSVFSSSKLSNIFEFKAFIDLYKGKISVRLTDEESVAHEYTLVEIGDTGRYGINLKPASGTLFNNEMPAELALLDNGVKTVTINKYTDSNTSGFRLFTDKTITTKNNVKLSTMFLSSYFNRGYVKTIDTAIATNKTYYTRSGIEGSYVYTAVSSPVKANISNYYELSDVAISSSIIGVGVPTDLSWVDGATDSPDTTTYSEPYAYIKIPSSSGDVTTYNVQKVVYSGGTHDLCNITAEFYYIAESSVVVPDYNAVGIETTFFKIPYSSASSEISFDVKDAIKVWSMNGTTLEWIRPSSNDLIPIPNSDELSCSGSIISIERTTLDTYKLNNPTKKNYEPFNITVTVNGTSMYCEVVFSLYDYITVEVDYTIGSTDNITQTLIGNVAISQFDEDDEIEYTILTSDDLTKIQTIAEKGANGYIDYRNGDLIINGAKVNEYFGANPLQTKLSIICTITTEAGSIDFEVIVNKT